MKAAAELLRIGPAFASGRLGEAFRCVLVGHQEQRPSAALFRGLDGKVFYHDFHMRDGDEWYTLSEVYASQRYGEARKLRAPEQTTYLLRMLVETGFLEAAKVEIPPLPANTRKATRTVYEGFRFLLQCKWLYDPGAATVFTRRFAAAWCGVSAGTRPQCAIPCDPVDRRGHRLAVRRNWRKCPSSSRWEAGLTLVAMTKNDKRPIRGLSNRE